MNGGVKQRFKALEIAVVKKKEKPYELPFHMG
jgi:hypothetical protein